MENIRKIAGGLPWWGWVLVAGVVIIGIVASAGEEDGGSDDSASAPSKPLPRLATKASLTRCLEAAGLTVERSASRVGGLEVQGIATDYVGTVPTPGPSFVALWVANGENQTNPVGVARDLALVNGTGPDLNPNPATLDYYWDHNRNVLFALPVDQPGKVGTRAGARLDRCLADA